jgi:hypothetical protein
MRHDAADAAGWMFFLAAKGSSRLTDACGRIVPTGGG